MTANVIDNIFIDVLLHCQTVYIDVCKLYSTFITNENREISNTI